MSEKTWAERRADADAAIARTAERIAAQREVGVVQNRKVRRQKKAIARELNRTMARAAQIRRRLLA